MNDPIEPLDDDLIKRICSYFECEHPEDLSIARDGAVVRTFDSGATRDTEVGKLNYRRFFSPKVLRRRAEYMEKHRIQSNGELRAPDNWKKGIPLEAYADSLGRHHHEFEELLEAGIWGGYSVEDAICAQMFNLEGYLYELLSAHD